MDNNLPHKSYLSHKSVESYCGRTIECNYIEHPQFRSDCELSYKIHYIFILYSEQAYYSAIYRLRQSINILFDFVSYHNERHPTALQVRTLECINHEIFNLFHNFVLKNGHRAEYAATISGAIKRVSLLCPTIIDLQLPSVEIPEGKRNEPLYEDGQEQLINALKSHIDSLYGKLAFRKKVDSVEPYEMEAVLSDCFPDYSKKNIYRWFQSVLDKGTKVTTSAILFKVRHSKEEDFIAIANEPSKALTCFRELYNKESSDYLLDTPTNPYLGRGKGSIRSWVPDFARTIKTLNNIDYPYNVRLSGFAEAYGHKTFITQKQCDSIEKLIMHRFMRCIEKGRKTIKLPSWDDFLTMYYPSYIDMFAIVNFIMIQSGWNKETVLAIDGDNYEHILSGALDPDRLIVFSEKNKAQAIDKPYHHPKQFKAISNRLDKYSIYNLIKLAIELSAPLATRPIDVEYMHTEFNPIFLCLRPWAEWVKGNSGRGGRHTSITKQNAYAAGANKFFETYEVFDNGERLRTADDIKGRLRPTWVMRKRENNPLGLISQQQGHSDRVTTDVFYDNSGIAVQGRRQRLRSELESVVDVLRQRKFTGLLGKRSSSDKSDDALVIKIFHIPGHKTPLWGCSNQRKPDWPGAKKSVKQGDKCHYISQCMACSQVRIFEESLPYLMERLTHILEVVEQDYETTYNSRNHCHRDIIQFILDEWGDDEALKKAARFLRRYSPLLPRNLNSLEIIFDDE